MKKMLYSVLPGLAVLLVSGCDTTRLAEVPLSREEAEWERVISQSYPGYQPPKTKVAAIRGNMPPPEMLAGTAPMTMTEFTPVAPADAPAGEGAADALPDASAGEVIPDTPVDTSLPDAAADIPADAPAGEVSVAATVEEPDAADKAKDTADGNAAVSESPSGTESVTAESETPARVELTPEKEKASEAVAAPAAPAVEYAVCPGDTLTGIAAKFYKDANRWPVIFKANSEKITDPNRLKVGVKLLIPQL